MTITPIPCPHCHQPPVVEHSEYGYRCACGNRNRVRGRAPANLNGHCPNTSRLHWRATEYAAIVQWNAQGYVGHEYDSRVRVPNGDRCPHCHLLLPCGDDCPGKPHAIDGYAYARMGEQWWVAKRDGDREAVTK